MGEYMGRNLGTKWAWVSQLPARKGTKRALRDGVDWGYTFHSPGWDGLDSPIKLSGYWQRRFKANKRTLDARDTGNQNEKGSPSKAVGLRD